MKKLCSFLLICLFGSSNVFADVIYESEGYDDYRETYRDYNEPQYLYLNDEPQAYEKGYYEFDASATGVKHAPLPQQIRAQQEKVIIVDPYNHAWGAYSARGRLVRWGIATSGGSWCRDINKPCKTRAGAFRIFSMGDESCYSRKFPLPDGGAPMPYCMYFNGGQALHGSNQVIADNVSHGCVRMHVNDAKWLRYQFVEAPNAENQYRGTKVIIRDY